LSAARRFWRSAISRAADAKSCVLVAMFMIAASPFRLGCRNGYALRERRNLHSARSAALDRRLVVRGNHAHITRLPRETTTASGQQRVFGVARAINRPKLLAAKCKPPGVILAANRVMPAKSFGNGKAGSD
jgi:hypothetical protein